MTLAAPSRTARCIALASLMALTCLACDPKTPAAPADVADAPPVEADATSPTPATKHVALTAFEGELAEDGLVRKAQSRVELEPQNAEAWADLGRTWVRKARRDQNPRLYAVVEASSERALELDPTNTRALHLRALVAQDAHDFAAVESIASKLTDQNPKDVTAWGLLGDAALEQGKMPRALSAYQQMMDLYPGIPSYSRVAHVRWLHGDTQGALEMWGECLKAGAKGQPEPATYCLTESGHMAWFAGDLDEALRRYDTALARMPEHAGALFGRGRVHHARGAHAEAIADLSRSLEARRLEETFVWLAATHRAAGDTQKAGEMEAQLTGGDGHDDPRTISSYLSDRGVEPERALELARKDASQRGDLYTQDALAMALFRSGQLALARDHISKAISFGTPDPRLHAHAGLIHAALGERERALEMLGRASSLNPHAYPYLRAELERVRGELEGATP